ncbi:MAG TPA: adenine deaminase C-terminal domain-containing protein [Bacillota bacterium]|nr:adenine deaminase C-terminal domain-containing protein [Bacillota bacterium]
MNPNVREVWLHSVTAVSPTTGEAFPAEFLIRDGRIAAVAPPGGIRAPGARPIDGGGRICVPGFVDAHMHIESSFLSPGAFASAVAACGTTTVAEDPHDLVNIAGVAGMAWMVAACRDLPVRILHMAPSCVPPLPGLETALGSVGPAEVREMLRMPGVAGLAEVMDYEAAVAGDPRIAAIVAEAVAAGVLVDGHAPGLVGADLAAFLGLGIESDHTVNSPEGFVERARLGAWVQLQARSARPDVIAALHALPVCAPLNLVTDDVAADELAAGQHLNAVAALAVRNGMPPLDALRAITWKPAQRLRLGDVGVLRPGARADLVVLDGELAEFRPWLVLAGGLPVGEWTPPPAPRPGPLGAGLRLPPLRADDFTWPVQAAAGPVRLRAMAVRPADFYTAPAEVAASVQHGLVDWEAAGLIQVAVLQRYGGGQRARAPLAGLRLGPGAAATTYAHDTHNLVVVGTNAADMAQAAERLRQIGGGIAIVRGGRLVAELALPLGGVMSPLPAAEVAAAAAGVRAALLAWGYAHGNPVMSLATLSLSVSPALKLTDLGLVDVAARRLVSPLA